MMQPELPDPRLYNEGEIYIDYRGRAWRLMAWWDDSNRPAIYGWDPIDADPEVGMGATVLMHGDCFACTVVAVSNSGKAVSIQRDHARRTDNNGMSDYQEYEFTPNPHGVVEVYTLRKDGMFYRKGEPMGCCRLSIGIRDHFFDYSL